MNATKGIILNIAISLGFLSLLAISYFLHLSNSKQNDTLKQQITDNKIQFAILQNKIESVVQIDKIQQEGYEMLLKSSVENLNGKIENLQQNLKKSTINSNSATERRLLLVFAMINQIQKKSFEGQEIRQDVKNLLSITLFDENLNNIAKNLKDIYQIKTRTEIVEDYIKIARRLSQSYYKSKNRYIVAFFAKHFYLTNTNSRFYKIDTLINQGDFEAAIKELKFVNQNLSCEDAAQYIKTLEDYTAVNQTMQDIQSYIITQFNY